MFGKTIKHLHFTKTRKSLYFSYCVSLQSDLIYKLPYYAIKKATLPTNVAKATQIEITETKQKTS